ncbi:hypothetical protein ACWCXE_20085, partial [Streptomyces sp. NPDC001780]
MTETLTDRIAQVLAAAYPGHADTAHHAVATELVTLLERDTSPAGLTAPVRDLLAAARDALTTPDPAPTPE